MVSHMDQYVAQDMTLLDEWKNTLPAHYTLSNRKIIFIAHVGDETVYFYDQLGSTTTVVLLAKPKCYAVKKIFLELLNDMGTTVIDLNEDQTFDADYEISRKSFETIRSLLMEYNYEQIITHPKYPKDNDPQNRALYDTVAGFVQSMGLKNHYTYRMIGGSNTIGQPICRIKEKIIRLYGKAIDGRLDEKMYNNQINITSKISGVRKI
jgi:hypothetical protein